MITLVLEASTYEGSTALVQGETLVGERFVAMRGREHEALMAAVGELMAECCVTPGALGRIVCGAGPGSFTSLRIAASIAKGLALAAKVPLVPVSSLTLLAASFHGEGEHRLLAILDAMRGERYVQLHEAGAGGAVMPVGDVILMPATEVEPYARHLGAVTIGPSGAGHHVVPRAGSARHITNLIDSTQPADLAGWEPGYGRLAEAQVKWESVHGRPLPA